MYQWYVWGVYLDVVICVENAVLVPLILGCQAGACVGAIAGCLERLVGGRVDGSGVSVGRFEPTVAV